MLLKAWFLPFLIGVSALASPSPTPQYPSPVPPRSGYYPASSQRPVYTAQRARGEHGRDSSREEDEEPYPSTSQLGTAQTTHGAIEEPENTGFVDPIDFKNLLRDVEDGSKGLELGASSSNPLFASESKNSFDGFFGSNNKDPFKGFGSGIATASSERNSKTPANEEDSTGFVDPNVQFRSLFESSQTSNSGFKPEDFLGYKGDASNSEPSKGSQTQTFPSFTYSGRKDDNYGPSSSPKYRSSYRQIESQDNDYNNNNNNNNNNNYRHRDDREDEPSYNDYNRGGEDEERGPSNSPGYNQGPSQSSQETSNRPQSTGKRSSTPKTAESKNPKCKKVEKTVDYQNDDYNEFTEPESDYDPSTYSGRHKRQSRQGRQSGRGGGGGSGGNKRPMTCYVCEDEQGRYAERCSYDSKANPNKGEYFHSSSSAYSDNGRNKGKTDRSKRNPNNLKQNDEASATTSLAPPSNSNLEKNYEESEPKVIEKRQSNGGRYASNFGGSNNRGPSTGRNTNRNNNNDDEFDYNPGNNGGDYDLPRGYIGNNGRIDDFGGNGGQIRESTRNSPSGGRSTGSRGPSSNEDNFGFGRNDNNNNREFGFNNAPAFNDFNFGNGNDFGRESSPSGGGNSREPGFNFDFSIPREYDPDIQLPNNGNNNRNHNPDGSASSPSSNSDNDSHNFPTNFDTGYDDYVKEYFPSSFGGGGSSTNRPSSSSFSPSSGPSISSNPSSQNHNEPNYRPRHSPSRPNSFNQYESNPRQSPHQSNNHNHDRGSPEKQHTQPSHNFAPPPNFFNDGSGGGFENSQNLNNLMQNFDGRDRSGCQKIQKGDMSCYVCKDAKGMNKEECMYASNDPKNQRMAYHEVTEYSSDPPASVLPAPLSENSESNDHRTLHQSASSPVASSVSKISVSKSVSSSPSSIEDKNKPKPSSGSVTRLESKIVSMKSHEESPVEYDFDY